MTALLESVLSFYDRFARQNATNPRLEGEAAWAYRKVGALYERLGRDADAEAAYARAVAMFEALVARYPNVPEYRAKLIQTYDLADPRSAEAGSLGRLEQWLRRARVLADQLAAEAPTNEDHARTRVSVYVKLGRALERRGYPDEAEPVYREALALEGQMIERSPSNGGHRLDRATTREALALIALERGRRDEARALLDEAVADLNAVRTGGHAHPPLHTRLRSLAQAFRKLGADDRADELALWADKDESEPHPPPSGGRG